MARNAPIDDVEVTSAPKGWPRRVGRVLLLLFVVLSLITQVRLIVQNFTGPGDTATTAAPEAVDPAVAAQVAGTYAADYLTHNPTTTPTGDDVWRGVGWSAADLVIPGQVQALDPSHAVVAMTVRVELAMPTSSTSTPAQQTAAPIPGAAASGDLPKGFTRKGSVWLPLQVPVAKAADGTITASAPVFGTDPASARPGPVESDPTATAATKDYALAFLTSYAQSATTTQYMTSPGVDLRGLGGVVAPLDLTSWTLTAADPAGVRVGTATIRWGFKPAGVDLSVAQTYNLTLTNASDRWFTTTITPTEGASK